MIQGTRPTNRDNRTRALSHDRSHSLTAGKVSDNDESSSLGANDYDDDDERSADSQGATQSGGVASETQ